MKGLVKKKDARGGRVSFKFGSFPFCIKCLR